MSTKQALINELNQIFEHTAEEAAIRSRSNEYLYKGLAWVYLWWVRASKEKGFLEEQYAIFKIRGHKEGNEKKFYKLLQLTWRLDWKYENRSNLAQWNQALQKIHVEYESNKDAYRIKPQERIAQFIDASGGIRKLIGADKYDHKGNSEKEKKFKSKFERSEDDKALIDSKHLELGVQHFASAKAISNIQSTKPVAVNRMGYALALIRAKSNGTYSVLATVNDEQQIRNAIISSYQRDNTVAPTVLQLLCEVISTQSIPLPMEPNRDSLQDTVKIKTATGEILTSKQYKRVLFRKKQKDILLSENRTACSVVTQVKPYDSILTSSKDVYMRVQDRRYVEQLIIQQHDLSLYSANDKNKIPAVRDTDVIASHKLIVEHKLLKTRRAIYFYTLEQGGEYTSEQADVSSDYNSAAQWTATVDKHWLENLYVGFVGGWLDEYGKQITRPKHKTIRVELGRTQLVFKHYGERGNLTTASKQFEIATVGKTSKPIKPLFLTKDLLPVLANLAATDIVGTVKLSANEDKLVLTYKTQLAAYTVSVPTCLISAKRNSAAFAAYGG